MKQSTCRLVGLVTKERNTREVLFAALFQEYECEGIQMPYTMEDFIKGFVRENMHKLPIKERLAGLKAEERLAGHSKEQIEGYLKRIGNGRPDVKKRPPKKGR